MAQVTIKDEAGERTVELREQVTTFGRGRENTVVISDKESSRRQFQIECLHVGYKLVDLESRNGTIVNGKIVNQHVLRTGDRIEIGGTTIAFEDADEPSGSALAEESPARSRLQASDRRAGSTVRRAAATSPAQEDEGYRMVLWLCVAAIAFVAVILIALKSCGRSLPWER